MGMLYGILSDYSFYFDLLVSRKFIRFDFTVPDDTYVNSIVFVFVVLVKTLPSSLSIARALKKDNNEVGCIYSTTTTTNIHLLILLYEKTNEQPAYVQYITVKQE